MPAARSGSAGARRLWEARRTPQGVLPLFAAAEAAELGEEADAELPAMPLPEEIVTDYQVTRLSLKGHPMQFLRGTFEREGVLSCKGATTARNGSIVRVAGVVLIRQRPGKGNALFITLEDETGITNVLLWARDFERYRREVMAARLMEVEGEVQRSKEGVMHLIARRVFDRSALLNRLTEVLPLPMRPIRATDIREMCVFCRNRATFTERSQRLDDRHVGDAAAFAHRLQADSACRARGAHGPGSPSAWCRWRRADGRARSRRR